MGRLSDDTANATLDAHFGGVTLPIATTHKIGLSSTQPADDGTNITEPTGGAYAQVEVDNDLVTWDAAADRHKANAIEITFPEATDDWGDELGWFFVADGSTDDFIGWGKLGAPVTVETGSQPSFDVGDLIISAPRNTRGLMAILPLTSWDADESQQFHVDVELSGTLTIDVAPVDPAEGFTGFKRLSLTYPTPTLDSYKRPVDWLPTATVDEEWGRLQLVIAGQDHTMFRGAPVDIGQWRTGEPFGDLACSLALQNITPFDTPGAGSLAWLAAGQHVQIRLIRPNGSRKTLWDGMLVSEDDEYDETSGVYVRNAIGPLMQADLSVKMASFNTAERDIGTVIPEALNEVQSRDYAQTARVATGIMTRQRGSGTARLTGYIQDLLATATTADGSNQWTLLNSGWRPVMRLKDRTTVHATVTCGQPGVIVRLRRDHTEAPNVIYGEGTAPDGCHWRNTKYPNLRPDDAPLYPLTLPAVFTPGDADTGFAAFATEMRENGYRMYSGNTYDARDEEEVRDAQARGGILVDGIVGPQTWATVFEVGSNGGDLSGAWFAPLAIDQRVEPYLYNAQGGRIGPNPSFEPNRLRVERFENFGEGISRAVAVASARAELRRVSTPVYVGTITLRADPQQMSRLELRAGMNLLLKQHRGTNRMLHIAGADVDPKTGEVTLTVDEKARDLLTIAAIRTRNKDAANDPARRSSSQRRTSRLTHDNVIPWDCEAGAGIIPRHALYGGLWTVLRIPAGQVGTIARSRFTVTSAHPFAVGIFSSPVTANRLAALVGNPLGASSPWSTNADALEAAGLLMAWGSADEPAGYYPSSLSEGGGVTGRLVDDAGWQYESARPPWLFVAEYCASSCYIEGRLQAAPEGT